MKNWIKEHWIYFLVGAIGLGVGLAVMLIRPTTYAVDKPADKNPEIENIRTLLTTQAKAIDGLKWSISDANSKLNASLEIQRIAEQNAKQRANFAQRSIDSLEAEIKRTALEPNTDTELEGILK